MTLIYYSTIQYEKINEYKIITGIQKFNKTIRKLVSHENKQWYKLIEYHSRIINVMVKLKPTKQTY